VPLWINFLAGQSTLLSRPRFGDRRLLLNVSPDGRNSKGTTRAPGEDWARDGFSSGKLEVSGIDFAVFFFP
jgi:hypothetical protein